MHAEICSVCCGTKRAREITCPEDCPHLQAGRAYLVEHTPNADVLVLTRQLSPDLLNNIEYSILVVQKLRFRDLKDREVGEALDNVLKGIESKIIYEFKSLDPRVEIITQALRRLIQLHQEGKEGLRRPEPEELVTCLKTSRLVIKGTTRDHPESTAYLDLIIQFNAGRLIAAPAAQSPFVAAPDTPSDGDRAGRLIQLP